MDVDMVEIVKKPLLLGRVRRMLSRYLFRLVKKPKIACPPEV